MNQMPYDDGTPRASPWLLVAPTAPERTTSTATEPTEPKVAAPPPSPQLVLPSLVAGRTGAVTVVGFLLAAFLLALSYSIAATGPADDQVHYAVFWIAMLAAMLPVGARLLAVATARHDRLMLVIGLGLLMYLPKYLRGPSGVIFHDEFAHARQVQLITDNDRLGDLNPLIQIVQSFPGLHSIAAYLEQVTGIGTPATIVMMIALCHALVLGGIFVLAEGVTGSSRVAGIAAFIYSLNASYLYFDAQFSYESLSLPLMLWTLVAVDRARRHEGATRWSWALIALVLASATVVTHHLTSYILGALLLVITAISTYRALRRRGPWSLALLSFGMALTVAVEAILWAVFRAPLVQGYLEPRITQGFGQLFNIASRRQEGRQLFAQSTLPQYERIFGFLVAPVALVATAGGLWLVYTQIRKRKERLEDLHLALVGLGLLYLPSFPLLLSVAGNEGARRSWAHSYIGLSVLTAPFILWLWDRRKEAWARIRPPARARAGIAGGLLTAGFTFTLVGNTAIGLNETYRFPGPYVYGSDTRSITPELVSFSDNFDKTYGPGNRVVGDRYTTLLIGTIGRQETSRPSGGFQVWQMYFDPFPSDGLLSQLKGSGWEFFVVDKQMGEFTPRIGVYFEPDEPQAQIRTEPPNPAYLRKYERLPFTPKIEQTNNLNLYRLNFNALDAQRAGLK